MSVCECCWRASAYARMMGDADAYSNELREHEKAGCPCTKKPVGAPAQAAKEASGE